MAKAGRAVGPTWRSSPRARVGRLEPPLPSRTERPSGALIKLGLVSSAIHSSVHSSSLHHLINSVNELRLHRSDLLFPITRSLPLSGRALPPLSSSPARSRPVLRPRFTPSWLSCDLPSPGQLSAQPDPAFNLRGLLVYEPAPTVLSLRRPAQPRTRQCSRLRRPARTKRTRTTTIHSKDRRTNVSSRGCRL